MLSYNKGVGFDLTTPREYRPSYTSRRGEFIAWALFTLLLISWGILRLNLPQYSPFVIIMAGLFFLAALIISFGNWVDRKTVLKLDTESLLYKNGLRTVHMNWDEIQSIGVKNIYWGAQRVEVYGQQTHFSFQTEGTVSYRGDVQDRTGFPQGEEMLEMIVEKCNLQRFEKSNAFDYYYARE